MASERVSFSNRKGETLAGLLDKPAGDVRAWALFAHCFTCSKNLKAATHLARALNARGIAVLRFDFTGLGQSEGEFGDTSFSSNVDDLLAADLQCYLYPGEYAPVENNVLVTRDLPAKLAQVHDLWSARAAAEAPA